MAFAYMQRIAPSNGQSRNVQTIASGAIVFCYTFIALALVCSILVGQGSSSALRPSSHDLPPCVVPVDRLRDLRLSTAFDYHCTPVQAVPTSARGVLTSANVPVNDNRRLWRPSRSDEFTLQSYEQMLPRLHSTSQRDTFALTTSLEQYPSIGKEVMFGMASDADRIRLRAEAMAHWIAGTGALLVISLPDSEKGDKATELNKYLTSLNIHCKIVTSAQSAVERYFHLTIDFAEALKPYHKWFIWADDDTFFVSAGRLNALLSKYDSNELVYIGNLSEDWFQIRAMDELFAFGGGGVITSRALLQQLEKVYPECNSFWPRPFGDYHLARCVYGHTSARLTLDYSMHQGDLKGNVAGLFESGRMFTTLHHWNSWWFNVDVVQYVAVASKTTAGSVGERFAFQSPSRGKRAVLTNGFSIVEYPEPVFQSIDFSKMERTWDNRTEGDQFFFDFTLGPLRYPLKEGVERFTHTMERSWIDSTHPARPVHQLYVQRAAENAGKDDVIHLMWI